MKFELDSMDAANVKFVGKTRTGNYINIGLARSLWVQAKKPVELSIDFYANNGARLIVWGEASPS